MSDSVDTEQDEVLVKKRARAIFVGYMAVGIFVIWMMISSALDVWAAYESRKSNEAAADARAQIISCVLPEGTCYKDGQRRTAEAIEQIFKDGIARETVTRQIIILSDWCADQPNVSTLDEREECVNNLLKQKLQEQKKEGTP